MKFFSDGHSSGWKRALPGDNSANTSVSDDDYSFLPPTSTMASEIKIDALQFLQFLDIVVIFGPSSPSRSPGPYVPKPPKDRGPHDLASCTIRTRAPVLRVFVPCSEINYDVLTEINLQMSQSGLKEFMFKGDIICNLGYVPTVAGNGSGSNSSGNSNVEWLVFDGSHIVPLEASSVSHPLTSSFSSPFYHHAFLPVDPITSIRIPRTPTPHTPLTLTVSHATIPSLSQLVVRVKKYSWVTSLYVDISTCISHAIGEGWNGEWVLEGEGTKEGRSWIEYALKGEANLFWEVDSEKSQNGDCGYGTSSPYLMSGCRMA